MPVIQVRQLPPIPLGSPTDAVYFASITNGSHLVSFPVMAPHAHIVRLAAAAKAAGEQLDPSGMAEPPRVAMHDAHALHYLSRPEAVFIEISEKGSVRPALVTPTEFLPVSTSTMALMAAAWDVPLVVDEATFAAAAVPIPQGEQAREWDLPALSSTLAAMVSTRFQGIEFDLSLPEHLKARFSP